MESWGNQDEIRLKLEKSEQANIFEGGVVGGGGRHLHLVSIWKIQCIELQFHRHLPITISFASRLQAFSPKGVQSSHFFEEIN